MPNDAPTAARSSQQSVAESGIMPKEYPTSQPTVAADGAAAGGWAGGEAAASLTQVALGLFAALPSLL